MLQVNRPRTRSKKNVSVLTDPCPLVWSPRAFPSKQKHKKNNTIAEPTFATKEFFWFVTSIAIENKLASTEPTGPRYATWVQQNVRWRWNGGLSTRRMDGNSERKVKAKCLMLYHGWFEKLWWCIRCDIWKGRTYKIEIRVAKCKQYD